MFESKWDMWPPRGFKDIKEYIALMAVTGLWGSREYAANRLKGIRLDKLRRMLEKHRAAPIDVVYPIQRIIKNRTKLT